MAPEAEISWVVAHPHRDRSNDWYWGLGVLALVGALASIFFGNILLALIIVIGAISIGILSTREPREHTVKLDHRGIVIDGTRYPYSSIHSFWVEKEVEVPHLYISMRGILNSHFSFELQDQAQGNRVREFLKQFATEEEQGPHLGDYLAEIFGL